MDLTVTIIYKILLIPTFLYTQAAFKSTTFYYVRGRKGLREDGFILMIPLNNNMCETRQWPKDLIEVMVLTLKKRSKAAEAAPTAQSYIKDCNEDILGEDQSGFGRGKGNRNAVVMLRITSE
jgi:hypothetical protein